MLVVTRGPSFMVWKFSWQQQLREKNPLWVYQITGTFLQLVFETNKLFACTLYENISKLDGWNLRSMKIRLLCLLVVGCYLFYLAVHLCTMPLGGFLLKGLTLQLGQFMWCRLPGGNEATGKPTVNPQTFSLAEMLEVLCVSSFDICAQLKTTVSVFIRCFPIHLMLCIVLRWSLLGWGRTVDRF